MKDDWLDQLFREISGSGGSSSASPRAQGASQRKRKIVDMRETHHAKRLRSGEDYDRVLNADELWPQRVTIIGRWACNGEEFPSGLLGRIVHEERDQVHVWFKKRGVFRFPREAVKQESLPSAQNQPRIQEAPRRRSRFW